MISKPDVSVDFTQFWQYSTIQQQAVRLLYIRQVAQSAGDLNQNHGLFVLVRAKSEGGVESLGQNSNHLVLNSGLLDVLAGLSEALDGADGVVH